MIDFIQHHLLESVTLVAAAAAALLAVIGRSTRRRGPTVLAVVLAVFAITVFALGIWFVTTQSA